MFINIINYTQDKNRILNTKYNNYFDIHIMEINMAIKSILKKATNIT